MLFYKQELNFLRMKHNLKPPSHMREAVLVVDDMHKVHILNPKKHHYLTHFSDKTLRMSLRSHGKLSCFPSKKTLDGTLDYFDFFLTMYNANPHKNY